MTVSTYAQSTVIKYQHLLFKPLLLTGERNSLCPQIQMKTTNKIIPSQLTQIIKNKFWAANLSTMKGFRQKMMKEKYIQTF